MSTDGDSDSDSDDDDANIFFEVHFRNLIGNYSYTIYEDDPKTKRKEKLPFERGKPEFARENMYVDDWLSSLRICDMLSRYGLLLLPDIATRIRVRGWAICSI